MSEYYYFTNLECPNCGERIKPEKRLPHVVVGSGQTVVIECENCGEQVEFSVDVDTTKRLKGL